MQVAIGGLHLPDDFAMDGGDAVDRVKNAAQIADEIFDGGAIAADDAFVLCVNDQEINTTSAGKGLPNGIGGPVDHADDPIHFFTDGKVPASSRGVARTGEFGREECGCVCAGEHLIALCPRSGGEETGGFAEAVADDGGGFQGEGREKIVNHGAQRDVGENKIARRNILNRFAGPEAGLGELRGEVFVLAILLVQDLRKLRGQIAAHAGELRAGTGEDEGDFIGGVGSDGCGGKEDAVGDEGLILREGGGGLGDECGELCGGFNHER